VFDGEVSGLRVADKKGIEHRVRHPSEFPLPTSFFSHLTSVFRPLIKVASRGLRDGKPR